MRLFVLLNEDYQKNNNIFTSENSDRYMHNRIWWHGSPNKSLSGKKGIHIGSKKAATQALESRIGVPSQGVWDGTREYGKTLLAGNKRLLELEKERGYMLITGYNAGKDLPNDDYYPTERTYRAKFSDGTEIPFDSKPIIYQVAITGKMTNSPSNPHSDQKANSMMMRNLKMGNAKSGYYYVNIGEDSGSISAVVPDASFLRIL